MGLEISSPIFTFTEMSSTRQKPVSYFEEWLKKNKSNIVIVDWNGSKNVSVFKDLNSGKVFEYKFCRLRDLFKRNPDAIPCSTSKERLRGIVGQSEEAKADNRKKAKNTWIEKYGVDNPSKDRGIAEKISKTNSENHSFLEKTRESMKEKYGAPFALQVREIKDKQKETVQKKFGVENVSQCDEIKKRKKHTKIQNGHILLFDGKQIKELAQEKNLSYSKVQSSLKSGIRQDLITAKRSGIEQIVSEMLVNTNLQFVQGKDFCGLRPDFRIDDFNLVIECDGLYWHSDKIRKDGSYHKNKKQIYSSQGFSSLFFREDEILSKAKVVESIIKNKLNLNQRIFARKCELSQGKASFFEENHLMGKGSGRIYELRYDDEAVAAIQVKWKSKKEKILEISRFCTKNEISVIGGYSKLISHVEKIEKPNKVITFVDLRYGSGEYLEKLGFKKKSEYLSFQWTDFKKTYHRMRFPGNSGYEYGMYKIWDCGQRLYEKLTQSLCSQL